MNKKHLVRQIAFFGAKGQEILNKKKVVILGVGGVGSHIAQQLAFLSVASITLIDHDILEDTNRNRLVGLHSSDPVGMSKVEIIARLIKSINKDIEVKCVPYNLFTTESFEAVKAGDFLFSCVDNDGARLVINELCLAYEIPFFDIASDILEHNEEYGGHVITVIDASRCLHCLEEIDAEEARRYLQDPEATKAEERIYGVDKVLLKGGGPSVVSLNGIVASIAVTEFMVYQTEIRPPFIRQKYHGTQGLIRKVVNHDASNCYYCKNVRGQREKAEIEREYIII